MNYQDVKLDDKGLIPAIVQDKNTKEVLMVAYMNQESLRLTIETKKATFFSRSRQKLWVKGETSGNFMMVEDILVDCDEDALVLLVEPKGPACHTGHTSCFYRKLDGEEIVDYEGNSHKPMGVLDEEYAIVLDRKKNPQEGSYTNYLYEKGLDKILKKVGEEASETIIAAKNGSKEEVLYESADLLYHLMVMLCHQGITLDELYEELENRR